MDDQASGSAETPPRPLRVLELYSGIGGMHQSLILSGVPHEVVAAVDINDVANTVYRDNYCGDGKATRLMQRNIESITPREFQRLNVDVWTMSPPCQPFTRAGKAEWSRDPRTKSLLYLLEQLQQPHGPRYVLLENVKGFELSDTRDATLAAFHRAGYDTREYLLNSRDFGIPNSRLRYYLLARQTVSGEGHSLNDDSGISTRLAQWDSDTKTKTQRTIGEYLETDLTEEQLTQLRVPQKLLCRSGALFDIVTRTSDRSCCFTKAYTKYVEGTGSVFTDSPIHSVSELFARHNRTECDAAECPLLSLQIRFFSPREIARLHSISDSFSFDSVSHKQKYRLLGNGVNSFPIAKLFQHLFNENVPL